MCQLLGLSSHLPMSLRFSLDSFMRRGGETGDHVDGWGIAHYTEDKLKLIVNTDAAAKDPLLQQLIMSSFKTQKMIAHVRKATQGAVSKNNCHPFVRTLWGQQWSFAHNGDLKEFNPQMSRYFSPEGHTDSERAFCYILNHLVKSFGSATPPDVATLRDEITQLAQHIHQIGSFNFLLTNGSILFAFCSTDLCFLERKAPFQTVQFIDSHLSVNFSDLNDATDKMVIISTKPLTHDEPWLPMTQGELYSFGCGEQVAI